jgi:peptide methionine sulfoxide reductase MsrA
MNPTVQIAARNTSGIVQPVQATPDGALRVSTGFATPAYTKYENVRFTSPATNNTHYVEFLNGATSVARLLNTFFGAKPPTADNDDIRSVEIAFPPYT